MDKRQLLRKAGTLAAVAAGMLVFAVWLLPVLLPFAIGLALAVLAEKPVVFLMARLKLPRWLASFLCVLAIFAALTGGVFLLCKTLLRELGGFLEALPELLASLADPFSRLQKRLVALAEKLPDGIGSGLRSGLESLFESGSLLGSRVYEALFDFASGLLGKLPNIFLFLMTAILASFMTSGEFPQLRTWIQKKLPPSWQERANGLIARLKATFGGWLKAQGKLMSITFLLLTAGFLLLRVDYPLLFGVVTTVVDALPVFGTGTVLIPWALVMFLQGNLRCGIGFLVLYGVAALMRQALEPRLVGKQLGLDPLVTLMALYIGFRVIGLLGMIVFPLGVIFLKQLWDHANPQTSG